VAPNLKGVLFYQWMTCIDKWCRDVEALKQLFPTLDNHFVVSSLAEVQGDVSAAFEYLLDAGILPGKAC